MASPAPAAGQPFAQQASEAAGQAYVATKSAGSRILDAAHSSIATQRPWRELHDSFSAPRNLVEASSRIRKNTSYFFSNYVAVLVLFWVLSLLFHPGSFFWLVAVTLCGVYLFLIRPADQPLVLMGRPLTSVDLAWVYAVLIILVCLTTSVGSLITGVLFFWVFLVVFHATFREPDESVPDDGSHPFLAWLGGPTVHQSGYAPVGVFVPV